MPNIYVRFPNAGPETDPGVLGRFAASQGFGNDVSAPDSGISGAAGWRPVTDPEVLSSYFTSQASGQPDWSVTDIPPPGALFAAPKSFDEGGSQAIDNLQPVTDPDVLGRFFASQALDAMEQAQAPPASVSSTPAETTRRALPRSRGPGHAPYVPTPYAPPAPRESKHPPLTAEQEQIVQRLHSYGYDPAAEQFVKGLSLNWSDELGALLSSARFGTKYEDELAAARELSRRFEKEYPKTATVLELAGSVMTPGGVYLKGAKAAIQGARLINEIRSGAKVGAITGAISGAGEGENLLDRATGAVARGAFGLVGGGASPIVMKGGEAVLGPVFSKMSGGDAVTSRKLIDLTVAESISDAIRHFLQSSQGRPAGRRAPGHS